MNLNPLFNINLIRKFVKKQYAEDSKTYKKVVSGLILKKEIIEGQT